ncbi:MAG: hypothetical protein A3H45_15805 [Ignavibacteria bacterium RIFCSPLOWO2_02_FULL_55_14]|nr:MAG: hypothetical protein A3C56_05640 [Ignavibacteria bacterium RIFCSPHIGHO2_02_FULL_56_12]OGU71243.1 MAG: hypothetical protein A3H45_15805 [Ignavibacteria bacterium RIFCSPLOWO2_02_FULL_55_14]OGU74687.1 MAG: hypothetical protein A3G43_00970 [Ignavibacteria bacterium RIFCSPLOWO2_12_FULL_56_21]
MKNPLIAPSRYIEKLIHMVRGQKVILDADLAHIYGITTRGLINRCDAIAADFQEISCLKYLKRNGQL